MATVKYQLLSESENAPIYLRLSVRRGLTPRAKTGLYIFHLKTGVLHRTFPKTTSAAKQKAKI